MRQVFAIALITIRSAMRSRIVLSMLLLLSAVIILLPFSIRGDGTVPGFIQILLSYTLGLSTFILALTTVWAGCASVSTEVADKTIQMVTTKPVSTFQIWSGKWIGINLINFIFVAICGFVTYGMLQWHLKSDEFQGEYAAIQSEGLLTAREVYQPVVHIDEGVVEDQLRIIKKQPGFPSHITDGDIRKQIRKRIVTENNIVKPEGSISWSFGIVPAPGDSVQAALEFRFSPSSIAELDVRGRWLIGTKENPRLVVIEDIFIGRRLNSITFEVDDQWADSECIITYEDIHKSGASLIFDIDSTALLVPTGGFTGNYTRALLILFGKLSFLTAMGITAGCLFSLPVATFFSFFILLIIQFSGYIESIAQARIILPGTAIPGEHAMTWGTVILTAVYKFIAFILSPLQTGNPLNEISTGRLVSFEWTVNGLIVQGIVYAMFMGCLASLILRKRELALPTS